MLQFQVQGMSCGHCVKAVTSEIWHQVFQAREIKSERERIQKNYERYMELAKGDQEIAFNFLKASLANSGFEHSHDDFVATFGVQAAA